MSINDKLVKCCQVTIEDAIMTNLTILNDKLNTNFSLITYRIKIFRFDLIAKSFPFNNDKLHINIPLLTYRIRKMNKL